MLTYLFIDMTYNIEKIREEFPILTEEIYDLQLVYLDNAATTQKPLRVIEAIENYYKTSNANVHRGVHSLSQRATDKYEASRAKIAEFINAKPEEIVFTKGTTESINLVAMTFGRRNILQGDEIIISIAEHHSNFVPWQMLSALTGMKVNVVRVDKNGEFDMKHYESLLNEKTKLVAITHVSNTLGTVNPIKEIARKAHENGTLVLVDGAQAMPHIKIDVEDLNADFYCFSGHKMYGPMGIGVLYGKSELLNDMIPYQGGGEMIEKVTLEKTTYKKSPYKFEAGTPNVAGAIGLRAAIEFIEEIGIEEIQKYESELLEYATKKIQGIEHLKIIGTAKNKAGVISFIITKGDSNECLHPSDIGALLDRMGIAIRTGNHCTEPLMEYLKVPGTIRASFALYNTKEEVDRLVAGIKKAKEMLS